MIICVIAYFFFMLGAVIPCWALDDWVFFRAWLPLYTTGCLLFAEFLWFLGGVRWMP